MSGNIRKQVEESEVYQDYERILRRAQKTIDYAAMLEEVESLHKTRTSRKLDSFGVFKVPKMIDANLQDQAHRSRIVELRMTALRVFNNLQFAMTAIGDYMIATYGKELGSSSEQRQARIAQLTVDGQRFLDKIASFLEISEEAIKDIENSSWAFKHITTALELNSRPDVHV